MNGLPTLGNSSPRVRVPRESVRSNQCWNAAICRTLEAAVWPYTRTRRFTTLEARKHLKKIAIPILAVLSMGCGRRVPNRHCSRLMITSSCRRASDRRRHPKNSCATAFSLRGFETDNGKVSINETVLRFCLDAGIEFTRYRAYRKNDQACRSDNQFPIRTIMAPIKEKAPDAEYFAVRLLTLRSGPLSIRFHVLSCGASPTGSTSSILVLARPILHTGSDLFR
jgi:hypothetical protein